MQNSCDSPLDIPELRAHVAQFLSKSQLKAAAAVCKSWNATFTPFLYSSLSWRLGLKLQNYPNKQALRKHAGNIRSIFLLDHIWAFARDFPWDTVTQLQELLVHSEIENAETLDRIFDLIQRNRGLRKVIFRSYDTAVTLKLVNVLSTNRNLRAIRLYTKMCDLQTTTSILDICSQLDELLICADHVIFPKSLDSWPQFPSMKSLRILDQSGASLNQQFDAIRRCPRLRMYHTMYLRDHVPISGLIPAISQCRELSDLELMSFLAIIPDEVLAQIIKSCNRVTSLGLISTGYGSLGVQALRQHFCSLTRLRLTGCPNFTSAIILEVLTSCPALIKIKADSLEARDILGVVVEAKRSKLYPRDWVCLKLRSFNVSICGLKGKPNEWHRQILHQLSRLKKLEELAIGHYGEEVSFSRDGLDLRLEKGLAILADLKQLKKIDFFGLWQRLDVQDVEWMLREWPDLENFEGRSNANKPTRLSVDRVLNDARVYFSTY
ncbi:hypothetical protein BGX26_001241 [Mortierella sp. AD094]|nr:hypothetical protein BGX26_001241 [Mortierella sp. AD094]